MLPGFPIKLKMTNFSYFAETLMRMNKQSSFENRAVGTLYAMFLLSRNLRLNKNNAKKNCL